MLFQTVSSKGALVTSPCKTERISEGKKKTDLTMINCENDVCNEITHEECGILACNVVQFEESPT
jgi:hypothetical protein